MTKKLLTWIELQRRLRTATEAECDALLKAEQAGAARPQFLLRIFGRRNKLRTSRERRSLVKS